MKLPERYCQEMRELLGKEYGAYLASFDQEPASGLRVNRRKLSPEEFSGITNFHLRKVPWIDNGFYYEGAVSAARHPHYYAGLYYIQEPSAMTPASRLPVEPGDRVLDLCAAPGGKATELGARLAGRGFLLANDISASRAGALLKNLELAGIPNLFVTSEDPARLADKYPQAFDKILVDAPCSGEGMFRRDGRMASYWENAGPETYTRVQEELLEQAYRMLRPGGRMLYSTCTFSVAENEKQILRLLEKHPDLSPEDAVPGFHGFEPGLLGLKEAVRIYPHRMEGEGHFLMLLKKEGEICRSGRPAGKTDGICSFRELPEAAKEFLGHVKKDFSEMNFRIQKDQLYCLLPGMEVRSGIRYLRTGLLAGTVRKQRFEPYQALAMALGMDEFDSVMDFSSEDPRTVKYLKGETISVGAEDTPTDRGAGWQLVCTDGFPLGFGKMAGQNLKNKYHPGWRWQ